VMPKYAVCETTNALTHHLRVLEKGEELKVSGLSPRREALCGMKVAWDIRESPVYFEDLEHHCSVCAQIYREEP